MMPVIPNSINSIPLIPGTPFTTRKNECLKRCNILRNSAKQTWFSQKDVLPLSTSVRLFPQFRSGFSLNHKSRIHITSATGADLAVEEADSPVANEDSGAGQEIPSDAVGTSDESSTVKSDASAAPAQSKRPRPTRKSDMPPVKPEELVPGAAFNGKVRSIQPFGAFVDFGAFTDGLVHVSRLSDSFVTDVGNIVSVGQEVKVRLVEANMETGRISLTMRESDDISKLQQRTDAPSSTDKSRPPRKGPPRTNQKRNEVKKASKFAKGQDLEGTVKNLTRSGAFISLPEGEEGFLPTSEELDEGFVNMMGGSSLQVGQEVSVRVLRITRGQVTLTMKKEEAAGELDSKLQGVVHTATNPFLLAFRKNKDIGAFLDEREKEVELAESSGIPHTSDEMGGKVSQTETELDEVQEQLTSSSVSDKVEAKVNESRSLLDEREKEAEEAENSRIPQTSDEIGGNLSQTETKLDEVQEQLTSSGVSDKVEGKLNESGTLLDEKEKEAEEAESSGIPKTSDEMGGEVGQTQIELTEVQGEQESSSEGLVGALSAVDKTVKDDEISSKQVDVEGGTVQDASNEIADDNRDPENIVSDLSDAIDGAIQSMEEKADASSEILAPEESISTSDQLTEKAPEIDSVQVSSEILSAEEGVFATEEVSTNDEKSDLSGKITDPIMSESEISKEVKESEAGETIAKDVEITTPNAANEILSATIAEDEKVGINTDKNGSVTSSNGQIDIPEVQQSINEVYVVEWLTINSSPESQVNEVENEIKNSKAEDEIELKNETPAAENEFFSAALVEDENVNEKVKNEIDNSKANEELKNETPAAENEIPSAALVEDDKLNEEGKNEIDNSKVKDELKKETPAADNEIPSAALVEDEKVNEEVKNGVDNSKAKDELKNETSAADNEIPSATPVGNEKVGSVPEKNGTAINSNGQNGTSSPKGSTTNAISPALVKQLREETGAGMMDCKKALSETGGDLEKAQEFLRKKGLASADKKASRATAEGRIGSYIHDSRIGILIEVNCETDFVSRGDIFKELVDDLAMQAAACPQVQHLVKEDVPKETVDKEREIEMQKEDLLSKPEQIRSKIVEGRIRKRLEELALLEQPYIKNDKMVVKDWVKQTIATIGENIKVKRFVRYNLGEGLEQKSQDFAAEVAAQTAAKQVASPGKEQPAVAEAKGTVDTPYSRPPKATISAALVKQLREETGAGMMDCKKALSETGGDLEKAQEYLRKKGLSAADKKSSRLAAEGRIGSYIHDARIGVLIEVNCETDFVGRSEKFKELVDDLAMQVVACPQVQFVSIEDIPESVRIKEKELEMQREDLLSKPENIRERIVEGRISKRLGELALLEQPFIRDDSILVKDLVKQTVAALGENIKVRRFVRFTLGEMNETAKTENEA
ncbi:unnamed protein product [Camellia sinensis]